MTTAFDLIFNKMIIGNFNIMSHKASKFAIPASSFIHETSGETRDQWTRRYREVISQINNLPLDILCLQEVTVEFYNMLPVSFNETYHVIFKQDIGLLTLINKSKWPDVIEYIVPEYKYSKIVAYWTGEFTLVNVHLIGDPKKSDERRHIITEMCKNLVDPIVIGDFNESVDDMISDMSFAVFLDNNGFSLETVGNQATAYSLYNVNAKGFVTGLKNRKYYTIDNILYPIRKMTIRSRDTFPDEGLMNKQVPYKLGVEPWTYIENYSEWPSDHTLNMYEIYRA